MNTDEKNNILEVLKNKAESRSEQWYPMIMKELPDPELLGEMVLIGSYSYSLPQTRRRLMRGVLTIKDGVRETPTSIARDYLRHKYKRGPILKHDQFVLNKETFNPYPNAAKPTQFLHGVYVDISSAYWSIMGVVGWNVDYYPGKWIGPGTPPADFPFENHKICRNCLVSAGASGAIPRYIPPGHYDEITPGSPLGNPGLLKLISDVLNSIASQAMDAGAVYANTDGFIAPDLKTAAELIGIIEDWGLQAHVKSEGAGSVKSAGAYAVGTDVSVPFKMRKTPQPVERVYPPKYIKWLQDNFSYWAANV